MEEKESKNEQLESEVDTQQEIQEEKPKKVVKQNLISLRFFWLFFGIIIGIACCMLFYFVIRNDMQVKEVVEEVSPELEAEETIIEFNFKDIGELVTQEYHGRIIEDSSKDRNILGVTIPFTKSRLLFSMDVEVLAGMNFAEINYEVLNGKIVKIKLPKAEIFKSYYVTNTFKSYVDDESIFTNITAQEQNTLKDRVVEKGKQEALDSGILDKAEKNAKIIIEQVVKNNSKDLSIEWVE